MDNKVEIPAEYWQKLSAEIREAVEVFLEDVADNINDYEPDYILSDKGQVAYTASTSAVKQTSY